MMRYWLFVSVLFSFLEHKIYAQQVQLKPCQVYMIDSTSKWTVDVLGNTYQYKKDQIKKVDSAGVVRFTQSAKSLGVISQIHPINTMKLAVFSEEQQMICFFDNTLTLTDDCLELADLNFENVTTFSVSSQPNKFWLYDAANSKIELISIVENIQQQAIVNAKGLLNCQQIDWIQEINGNLYVVDFSKGVYQLDKYGTLLNFFESSQILACSIKGNALLLFARNELIVLDTRDQHQFKVTYPITAVSAIQVIGNQVYMQDKNTLKKYQIIFE